MLKIKYLIIVAIICGLTLVVSTLVHINETTSDRHNEARAQSLRNSIKQYHLQYGQYPLSNDARHSDVSLVSSKPLMDVLLANNIEQNPRKIEFGEWRTASDHSGGMLNETGNPNFGSLVDSWGSPYRIVFDTTEDQKITNPNPDAAVKILGLSILVYSAGPDGDFKTWDDNLKTW
ncbi:MAG: type II secretory pathway pseudopilin PulG [Verrucomicrobiales bacterium]|jgi:type II secretory pathway pseudopilin PulG